MKSVYLAFVVGLVASALPSSSSALVLELASCSTSDGKFHAFVQDNQGTGPNRESHITAGVQDAEGKLVAFYEAEVFHGIQSVSFGRPRYQDTQTQGQAFELAGPSTNMKNYVLKAALNLIDGSHQVASDEKLNCSVFGGVIVKQNNK